MEYVLETKALCKQYGHFGKALDNLEMHVPKGAIYGFVGRNGAGKTTLIRVITGLQEPTSGSYTIYGVKNGSRKMPAVRRRMGAVVETPSVYMNMTAKENLKTQFMILGMPSFDGLRDLLRLVGLENTGEKKVRDFSLGMRQRLGIAIALAGKPDFLVLDEPVNGLDPQGIVEIRELILKINHEMGITVLISSHILDELSRLATHYGFIDGGRIVKEISAEEFQRACGKKTVVKISNPEAFSRAAGSLGLKYEVVDADTAAIYQAVAVTALVDAAKTEGCIIKSISEQDESLESYYMNLVGGDRNE